jgi:hypothetical protein
MLGDMVANVAIRLLRLLCSLLFYRYKNGKILLLDVTKQSQLTLLKWRGHEDEITSLSWCTEVGDDFLQSDISQ